MGQCLCLLCSCRCDLLFVSFFWGGGFEWCGCVRGVGCRVISV